MRQTPAPGEWGRPRWRSPVPGSIIDFPGVDVSLKSELIWLRSALAAVLVVTSAVRADGLFEDHAALEVRLAGPLAAVLDAGGSRTEFPFTLTFDGHGIPLEVRTRGNSRLRVCDFPPLRLDFPRKQMAEGGSAGSVFAGQDKLKLVTHCSDKERDAGNLYDEYLAYRLFNVISEDSYRVRLLEVEYVDTGDEGAAPQVRDAFLIESEEDFAKRRGATALEAPGVVVSRLDAAQAARLYVFQYLIGNTDWSLVTAEAADTCCHNVDLFARDGRTLPVPYDFDLSGLVHASYARPDPSLRIASVRTRRYRGYCIAPEELAAALDAVVSLETEMLTMADAVPAVGEDDRRKRRDYLSEFFGDAADREALLKQFGKRCL